MPNRSRLNNQNSSLFSSYRLIDLLILVNSFFTVLLLSGIYLSDSYLVILTLTSTAFLYFSESFGLYKTIRNKRLTQRFIEIFTVVSLSFTFTIIVLFLLKESEAFSRVAVVSWYAMTLLLLMIWRWLLRYWRVRNYQQGKNLTRVAIIGLNETGRDLANEIMANKHWGLEFIGFYDDRDETRLNKELGLLQGSVKDALSLAQAAQVDSIYICIPMKAQDRIAKIIRTLSDSTVNVFIVPDFVMSTIMHGNLDSLGHFDTISVFDQPIKGADEFYKRAFDLSFSLFALILLLPVFIAIALAIKLTSKGPVFFKQHRHGLDGKPIVVHKFRSMTVMENSDKVVQAKKGDARITKVGGFLRRTSLDELPQFYDVLIGNMSVVGPRPHALAHNEEYRKLIDYYMLRHKVKPGITGWAQVNGWRGETDTIDKMEKRIEYDLQYLRNWTLWWDVKIVFLTIFKGFINKNAY